MRRRIIKDEKLTKNLSKKGTEKNQSTFADIGMELSDIEIGKPNIIWEDDNVSVIVQISAMQVNNVPFKELALYASTVINDSIIQIATFDEVGNFINTKAYTLDLAKNAARFKSMN